MVARSMGENPAATLTIFIIAIITGAAGLIRAHVMWRREHRVLSHSGRGHHVAQKSPKAPLHHRPENTHRQHGTSRGATRTRSD
jgi:hypothetical protein